MTIISALRRGIVRLGLEGEVGEGASSSALEMKSRMTRIDCTTLS